MIWRAEGGWVAGAEPVQPQVQHALWRLAAGDPRLGLAMVEPRTLKLRWINRSLLSLLGVDDPTRFEPGMLESLLSPASAKQLLRLIDQSGDQAQAEHRWLLERQNSRHRPVFCHVMVQRLDPEPGVLLRVLDHTDQQQTRRRLARAQREAAQKRELEQAIDLLMEAAPVGLAVADLRTHTMRWISQRACRAVGLARGDVEGLPLNQAIHRWQWLDDRDRPIDDWRQTPLGLAALEGQEVIERRYTLRHGDREAQTMIAAQPLHDEQGQLIGAIASCRDVGELDRCIERIEKEKTRFKRMTDALPQLLWTADGEGRITYVNRQWSTLTGRSLKDSINEGWHAVLQPDGCENIIERWLDAVERREPFEQEVQLRMADGSLRWHLVRAIPLRDNGHSEWLGTCTDIEQSQQHTLAVHEGAQRLRLALAYSHAAMWDWDISRDRCAWSEGWEGLYGVDPSRIHDGYQGWLEQVHPEDREPVDRAIYEALHRQQADIEVEFRILHPQLGVRWISGLSHASYDSHGHPARLTGINLDITARKLAEQQLVQFNQVLEQRVAERTRSLVQQRAQLRELASQLATSDQRQRRKLAQELHDYLAQMLVVTKMNLYRALRTAEPPVIESILNQTLEIIDKSIEYTRTLVAELSPSVLYDQGLGPALKWLGEQMAQQDLRVSVQDYAGHVPLPEDQLILAYQTTRELLMNVIKHAGADRAFVRLELSDDDWLRVTVADPGRGFDPREQPMAPTSGGRFGLFSIRERVQAIGGRFEITSRPNHGTTVVLSLPLREFDQDSAPPLTDPSPHEPLRKLVFCDAHQAARQGLRLLVETCPDLRVVGECENGGRAVAEVSRSRPNLLLIEAAMPEVDEAVAKIRQASPETRIAALRYQGPPTPESPEPFDVLIDAHLSPEQFCAALREACEPPRPRHE